MYLYQKGIFLRDLTSKVYLYLYREPHNVSGLGANKKDVTKFQIQIKKKQKNLKLKLKIIIFF
jgi:hypothetical protein